MQQVSTLHACIVSTFTFFFKCFVGGGGGIGAFVDGIGVVKKQIKWDTTSLDMGKRKEDNTRQKLVLCVVKALINIG